MALRLLRFLLVLFVVHNVVSVQDPFVHFHNFKLVRTQIDTDEQLRFVEDLNLDVWSRDSALVLGENDIMMNPSMMRVLSTSGIKLRTIIDDVEQRISRERMEHQNRSTAFGASWYDSYHTYGEIVQHLQDLATSFPEIVKYTPSIGISIEGKEIPVLIVGGTSPQKKIFFLGGQHAREWINPATTLFVTEQLITLYATDPEVKAIVDAVEFWVVPMANPDGYSYTWNTNRLWRKNRRPNVGGTYGVDLNRNWDDHWGGLGSSDLPSSDTYRGTAPFSEPETAQISTFMKNSGPYAGAIDFHSYGQLILRPYGWADSDPPNEATIKEVGDTMRDRILQQSSTPYTSQHAYQLYYCSGIASDWFQTGGGAPLAYTIELRDTGNFGFQLPANQIIPTGDEVWSAMKYYAQFIRDN